MADYFISTVVHQTIPNADMTPLERLLLTNIFGSELDGNGLYFYAEDSPTDTVVLNRAELEAALTASQHAVDSTANKYVSERLAELPTGDDDIDLDLSGTSWEFFFQDIIRRSATLQHVAVVSSFTCTKMRPDGFGGMAVLITADAIKGKSTDDILNDLLDEADNGPLLAAPGFGVHILLSLAEKDVRAQIPQIIEANESLTQINAGDVTDADIRTACLITVERTALAEERGKAVFKAAVRAIHEAEQRLASPT